MTRRVLLAGVFALALAFMATDQAFAGGVTEISACGTVISVPGEYRLAGDLACTTRRGVTITTSDVHLNLAGHTLSADFPSGSGIIVFAVSNVHINGGTITGFHNNIEMIGTTASHVNGMTLTGAFRGVRLRSAHGNKFNNNVVTGNEAFGYHFDGSNGSVVTSSDTSNNGIGGVLIHGNGNTIRDSVASGNGDFGIEVGGDGNTIQDVTASGNSFGIEVEFGSGNTMQSNTATGNIVDLFDADSTCTLNTWTRNTFGTADPTCIH